MRPRAFRAAASPGWFHRLSKVASFGLEGSLDLEQSAIWTLHQPPVAWSVENLVGEIFINHTAGVIA
jgi:hypothetical protein